jgi:hypothetical protein
LWLKLAFQYLFEEGEGLNKEDFQFDDPQFLS